MSTDTDKLWDILSDMTVCMVTTLDGDVLRARPMAPYVDASRRSIRFMTDGDSAKIFEMMQDPSIGLSFANPGKMQFASVSARAVVSRDRELIKTLWGPYAKVFFGGTPDDADVAIITAEPVQAEFWDNNSGKVSMAAEMTRAYFSDDGPKLGDNAKLDLAS